jgi:hypothetical protein
MSVCAAKNLEHIATDAKRGPRYLDEKRSLTQIVDGEFSPNVENSPDHSTGSFWIADGGVFNCAYESAERAAGICIGVRNLPARIYS